jgi:hypothetical protein
MLSTIDSNRSIIYELVMLGFDSAGELQFIKAEHEPRYFMQHNTDPDHLQGN